MKYARLAKFIFILALLFLWSSCFKFSELNYSDLHVYQLTVAFLSLILFPLSFFFFPKKDPNIRYVFLGISFIVVTIIVDGINNIINGISLLETLRTNLLYMGYFSIPTLYLVYKKDLNLIFIAIAVFLLSYVAVHFIAFMGWAKINFIKDSILRERFGNNRLSMMSDSWLFLIFITNYEYFRFLLERKKFLSLLHFFLFLFCLFSILFVYSARMILLTLLIGIASGYFYLPQWGKKRFIPILIISLFMSIIVFPMIRDELSIFKQIRYIIDSLLQNNDGNVIIRQKGLVYYGTGFLNSFGFGTGLQSTLRSSTYITKGLRLGYNPSDLRLLGVVFNYGILAFIFTIVGCVWLIKDLLRIQNNFLADSVNPANFSLRISVFSFFIGEILTMDHLFFWRNYTFPMSVFIVLVMILNNQVSNCANKTIEFSNKYLRKIAIDNEKK